MQAELRNNENRVRAMPATSATQRSLREVADLLPKTLSADFKYARQYVGSSYFMRPPTIDESANVSNSNYASANSNKQQGKSRKRYKNKNPANSTSRSPSPQGSRDGSDSDEKQQKKKNKQEEEMYCDICDYTNHNTCDCYRLKPLIKKYKAAFIKSYKTKKSSSKTSNANCTSHSENESVN